MTQTNNVIMTGPKLSQNTTPVRFPLELTTRRRNNKMVVDETVAEKKT